MAYREFAPPPPLRALVECGWSAGLGAGEPAHRHDVLPDGCMDLLWSGTELLVAGPDTRPHPARREPGGMAVGLRFAPGALPGLLGVPASALRDQRVPLAELHPRLGRAAASRLGDRRADSGSALVAVLADAALALPGGEVDRAAIQVAAEVGAGASAAATADALGWTSRTLHRRCLASFGYGPAVLRRVLRFRRATDLLSAGVPPAEAASRSGYADQPHLSRELRALGGFSPASRSRAAAGAA